MSSNAWGLARLEQLKEGIWERCFLFRFLFSSNFYLTKSLRSGTKERICIFRFPPPGVKMLMLFDVP